MLFLGLDGRRILNATITTGRLAFWERIQDLASEQNRCRLLTMGMSRKGMAAILAQHEVAPVLGRPLPGR